MSTTTIPTSARDYLDAVRRGLADLPPEDAEEVLQDLEAHVAELGEVDPATELGTPEGFIAEFRSSAGLDLEPAPAAGLTARIADRISSHWNRSRSWVGTAFEPLLRPLVRNRTDLRTTWIWTRGLLAVLAFSWITESGNYSTQWFLGNGFGTGIIVAAVATYLSVRLARSARPLWRRLDSLASVIAAGLVIVAIMSPHWGQSPDEFAYYEEPYQVYGDSPVLLYGPNGPIQNVFAYDAAGNPVEVLLYDEYGNPIQTLPEYAYDEFEGMEFGAHPFLWDEYEIRFRTDARGNPITNLFPLERYEWTQGGPRSAPQPPPVVVIPQLPQEAEEVVPEPVAPSPTAPTSTTMPVAETPPETTITEPPTTTTEG